jgi:hypothetical protein
MELESIHRTRGSTISGSTRASSSRRGKHPDQTIIRVSSTMNLKRKISNILIRLIRTSDMSACVAVRSNCNASVY